MTGMEDIIQEFEEAYERHNKQRRMAELFDILEQINGEIIQIEQRRNYLVALKEKVLKELLLEWEQTILQAVLQE